MTLNEVKKEYQKEYAKPIWLISIVNGLPVLDVMKDWAWWEELQKRRAHEESISPEDSDYEAWREGLSEEAYDYLLYCTKKGSLDAEEAMELTEKDVEEMRGKAEIDAERVKDEN